VVPHVLGREGQKRRRISRVTSTTSVWVGFAGLLLLMTVLLVDSVIQWRVVASKSATLWEESRSLDAMLDQLRTDVYHSATLVRDYLIESDDAVAANQKAELNGLRNRMEATLARYEKMAPPAEREELRELRSHVKLYWTSLAPALQGSAADRSGMTFLRDSVIPRRDELVKLVRQAGLMNNRDWDAGEARIQAVQQGYRDRVTTISLLALVLGGIVAALITSHVRHLERKANGSFDEIQQARRALQRLSDRLVTAQEEERRSLSRELHDQVGQSMSAMLVELGRLQSAVVCTDSLRERFAAVRRMAEDNVATIRNMALLLRPSMLDELGLVPALRWQAREVARRTGLKVKMIADEIDDNLPDSHRTCVYRVAQEALNNCVKHSQATDVRVVINRGQDGMSVSVQDNGIGFDPEHDKGLGLLGMAERVGRVGGRFRVESHPGTGTVVSVFLPIPSAAPKGVKEGAA